MGKLEESFIINNAGQTSTVNILVNYGFIKNAFELTHGSNTLVDTKIGFRYSSGEVFTVRGRKLTLKWIWNEWSGQPKSIVVVDDMTEEILWWHKSQSASKINIHAKMPKWGWIFIVACMAIPILALGGALPMVIGMVGAFTCRSLANDTDRSTAINVGLSIGVTVIAWVAFIGLIFALSNLA